jgi:hypothetical protein
LQVLCHLWAQGFGLVRVTALWPFVMCGLSNELWRPWHNMISIDFTQSYVFI